MYRFVLLSFVLFCISSPSTGQFRAIQSSAGGVVSSTSYSSRATVGEAIAGSAITSNQNNLLTGFYLMLETGEDNQGPQIFFVEIGDEQLAEQSEAPPTPLIQPANVAIPIATQISDAGSGVQEAMLFYRQGGMPTFTERAMNAASGVYTGSIEASIVGPEGLEYYVVARDSLDNISRTPQVGAHSIQIQIDAPGLQQQFSGDTTLTGYRLIAVPMELANASSSSVLSDLGTYNDRNWRLWRLKDDYAQFEGAEQYQELRTNTTFNPGDAFWLISRNNWTIQTGEAVSVSTKDPFRKNLNPGWNFISSPFNFTIPLQNVSLSSGTAPILKVYQQGWANSNSMSPFTGYAVDAGEEDNVELIINPNIGTSGSKQSPDSPVQIHSANLSWSVQIGAESNIAHDRDNFIGASNAASVGWDVLDRPEPPVIGDYLSVSFPHEEWGKVHRRYESDVRPVPSYGDEWLFEVISGTPQTVQLSFDGIEDVPQTFSIQLIDEFNQTVLDLREHSTYTLRTAGGAQAYPLSINIGESEYIEEQVETKNLRPDAPSLDQNYPNPFNPTTSIRYGLTGPSIVTLEVYNSLGQVVSTLVNHISKDAGYHVATWDALADDGSAVSSGLYLYRLSVSPQSGTAASPTVLTRKMMLIK